MKPEARCSLRNSWRALVSVSESEYMWPCGGTTPSGGHNLEIVWSVRRQQTCLGLAKDISEVTIYLGDWGLISPFGGGPSRDLGSRDVEAVGPGV